MGSQMTGETDSPVTIRRASTLTDREVEELAEILVGVVAAGASVGFIPPLDVAGAAAYWRRVLQPGVVLLLAEADGRIIGTGQLELALRPNGRERAEVCKVLVHPDAQGRGIGRAIMAALESEARRSGRRLLHLDTAEGDRANRLYRRMGYTELGTIPGWAIGADGRARGTTIYFKQLD
jgi:GNAT superfamily N-acetyltransferase